MAFPATFFAKHVYHPESLSVAFLTLKSTLFVMLSPLVAFPRNQDIAAGGFPITSRQRIDVSPPTSTSIVLVEVVADGLSGHKKAERLGLTYYRGPATFSPSYHPLHALEVDCSSLLGTFSCYSQLYQGFDGQI